MGQVYLEGAGGIFTFFCREKYPCGGMVLLLGFLAFLWCLRMVNRGEVVVECVANVVG
jgi:hypothetical protein